MSGREAHLKALEAQEEQRRLSREQFLAPRTKEEEVEIISLGGSVMMKSLTHGLRQELRQKAGFGTPEYDDDLFTRLVMVHTITDPVLTEEDIEAFKDQQVTVFDELVMQISLFNMMGAAEGLKKASDETPNSDSPSA